MAKSSIVTACPLMIRGAFLSVCLRRFVPVGSGDVCVGVAMHVSDVATLVSIFSSYEKVVISQP